MNITLTQSVRIAGVEQAAGTKLTVSDDIGEDLIRRKSATNDNPTFEPEPVMATKNLTGGSTISNGTGSAAFNACEWFGASPSASASTNTAAIQAALNAGGRVTLMTPGVYLSNFSHSIHSDTSLSIGPGVTIKQAPGNNKFFIANSNYAAESVAAVGNITAVTSVGSNTMSLATINFSGAPPVSVGGYAQVTGDTTNKYNGVWKVVSVGASSLSFLVPGASAPQSSGYIKVAPANANITIECDGYIDYDELNNSSGENSLNVMGVVFNRVANVRVTRANIINVAKYGFLLSNNYDCEIRNLFAVTGSDGVHCTGITNNFTLSGFKGVTGDDCFIWGANDTATGYVPVDGTGPCNGLLVEDVMIRSSVSRAVLLMPSFILIIGLLELSLYQ